METYGNEAALDETLQSLDFKSLLFLVMDNYSLSSVQHLISMLMGRDPSKNNEFRLLSKVIESCYLKGTGDEMRDDVIVLCREIFGEDSSKYINTFLSVYADFREIVPHLHYVLYGNNSIPFSEDMSLTRANNKSKPLKCELEENDLFFNSYNEHVCDECGEIIEPGEKAYFRADPLPVVRHRQCATRARRNYEFKYIDYFVKEIEYHESVFRFNENCFYILSKNDGGIAPKQHVRRGYIIDKNDHVIRMPDFGKFVIDFISGEDDYELIKKYRPYHVYLEFLIKLFGYDNQALGKMGGYKYLLREPIGRERYPELCSQIENIPISRLMFDPYIHRMVADDIIGVIYEAVMTKIFRDAGIYVNDQTVLVNGSEKTFSINGKDADADILVMVDKDGIYCVDSEKSLSFKDYFSLNSDYADEMIRYMMQFKVDK